MIVRYPIYDRVNGNANAFFPGTSIKKRRMNPPLF
jgi:hypothetical protein